MLGIVEDNSGAENKGKWDVAARARWRRQLGRLVARACRTQSKYPTEAAKLAEFLTNAQSQVAAFKLKGPLPTNLEALKNPDFQAYTNAYFNNAPTGKIFGGSVESIKPVHLGPEAPGREGAGVRAAPCGRTRAGKLNAAAGLGAVHQGRRDAGRLLSSIQSVSVAPGLVPGAIASRVCPATARASRKGHSHEPVGHDSTPPPPRRRTRPPTRVVRAQRRFARLDIKFSPYLYIAPFFILFGIFGLYPMVRTAWMSLHDWDLIGDAHVHRLRQLRHAARATSTSGTRSSTRSASSSSRPSRS